jgi:hypothetical protein
LLGCGIKLFYALYRFPRINAESRGALCTFLRKYSFCFPDSSYSLGITRQNSLLVPGEAVITPP